MSISDLLTRVPSIKQEENDCGSSVEKWFKKSLNYLLRNNRIGDRGRKYLNENLYWPFVLTTQ